jgi:NAD(P)-dependent dehydrogenase (short-subunit alcohol dehydrogenase family)
MGGGVRVAFVTGASSGLGRAAAILLARGGDRVACVGRDRARLGEVASAIQASGGRAEAIVADVTREAEVEEAVARCVERLGGLDVLVPAAGVIASGTLEATPLAEFDAMMDVNVRSVVHTMRCALPHLAKRPGNIVAISSTTGSRAFPGVFAYCVSKAALEQAVRCLALEAAGKGVRVNMVAPGVVVTELHRRGGMDSAAYRAFLERAKTTHPLGRVGEPDEVAAAIGACLPVDGGRAITCLR